MTTDDKILPVEVPATALSEDALNNLISSFILREGTDYGREEVSHEKKSEQVRRQIKKGDVKIVYDPETQSATLISVDSARRQCLNMPL